MACKKLMALLVLTAMSLTFTGCMSSNKNDGPGRTASRGRFGLGRKKGPEMARANNKKRKDQDNLENLSPSASMERDLKQLREREKLQAKRIKEMRGQLDQGSDLVKREEEKLGDIRNRIQSYDMALERYDMASSYRPQRDNAELVDPNLASSGDDGYRTAPVSATPSRSRTSRKQPPAKNAAPQKNQYAAYSPSGEKEAVLYSSSTAQSYPSVTEARIVTRAASPEDLRPASPERLADAGAADPQASSWIPPTNLYSAKAKPTFMAQSGSGKDSRTSEGIMLYAPARGPGKPEQLPVSSAPAGPSKRQEPAPAAKPAVKEKAPPKAAPRQIQESESFDDEVFTPDLFLN